MAPLRLGSMKRSGRDGPPVSRDALLQPGTADPRSARIAAQGHEVVPPFGYLRPKVLIPEGSRADGSPNGCVDRPGASSPMSADRGRPHRTLIPLRNPPENCRTPAVPSLMCSKVVDSGSG